VKDGLTSARNAAAARAGTSRRGGGTGQRGSTRARSLGQSSEGAPARHRVMQSESVPVPAPRIAARPRRRAASPMQAASAALSAASAPRARRSSGGPRPRNRRRPSANSYSARATLWRAPALQTPRSPPTSSTARARRRGRAVPRPVRYGGRAHWRGSGFVGARRACASRSRAASSSAPAARTCRA